MIYYKFKRYSNGALRYVCSINPKYAIDFSDGGVYYTDEEIVNINDLFLVEKMRVVKSGKTWLKHHINK